MRAANAAWVSRVGRGGCGSGRSQRGAAVVAVAGRRRVLAERHARSVAAQPVGAEAAERGGDRALKRVGLRGGGTGQVAIRWRDQAQLRRQDSGEGVELQRAAAEHTKPSVGKGGAAHLEQPKYGRAVGAAHKAPKPVSRPSCVGTTPLRSFLFRNLRRCAHEARGDSITARRGMLGVKQH